MILTLSQLLDEIKTLIINHIRSTDQADSAKHEPTNGSPDQNPPSTHQVQLLNNHPPKALQKSLPFSLPSEPQGLPGLLSTAQSLLHHSVNTWHQGFLDKLYASPHPVTLAADLLLTTLNTNVTVYSVSPALTLVEKETCRTLAHLFGFTGAYAGGVSQPGGSAANLSSIVIARNTLFPETKVQGLGGRRFVLFTSEHGHYSVEKAAQMLGLGSGAVRSVAADGRGCMDPAALERAIESAKREGEVPFYVNATAGTTVLGSFDPLDAIADVCLRHKLWMHVDASWGGAVVFSEKQRRKLKGIERADSIAMCPHKMMNVALTCSVLLGKNLRQFQKAMTLRAGYLFHADQEGQLNGSEEEVEEFWDLGDLTPQCGRRGDSLKLALSWIYYGTSGYAAYIDHAFEMAAYLAKLVSSNPKFSLLSENPPPCLQVCFYFNKQTGEGSWERNSRITAETKNALVERGFMFDYAPGEDGKFFRVVVNGRTQPETVQRLVEEIEDVASRISI